MIPKLIHYCWFGNNPKSDLIIHCIKSWHKYCPEYEIIEWNENNWDIHKYTYAEKAYIDKKWAFVSDVARLDILYNHGGIYLDTDVEILNNHPFEEYLYFDTILPFENGRSINTGMFFAARRESELCKLLLQSYVNNRISKDIYVVNTKMNRPVLKKVFPLLKWNGQSQLIDNNYFIGCEEYGKTMRHYGTRSWCENLPKRKVSQPNHIKRIMRKPEIFETLESNRLGQSILPFYTFIAYDLQDLGLKYFLKLNYNKLKNHFIKNRN